MASKNYATDESGTGRSLGVHPEFEGIVMPRSVGSNQTRGGKKAVRNAVMWDAAEAAFAYFNHWPLSEKQERLTDAVRYITENEHNPNRITLPVMQGWTAFHTGKSVDQIAGELWRLLEKGVKQRHEGMDKFLTTPAIGDEYEKPELTTGGIWEAKVVRRGDERLERAREIRLANAEIRDGRINIPGLEFTDSSPIFREHTGRERRHGYDSDILHIASYHLDAMILYINEMSPEKKAEKNLPPDYKVVMPYNFKGHEFLVVEAVARRYLPIKAKLENQRSLFAVSTFLNDHPELFSPETKRGLEEGNISVGVGKHLLEDKPHRGILKNMEDLLVKEIGYQYGGFAVDFRDYGRRYETVSIVYTSPDKRRAVHIIYDGKFDVPPLMLRKVTRGEWGVLNQNRKAGWVVKPKPKDSPFAGFGQWYPDFDRHSQRYLVVRMEKPEQYTLEQYRSLVPQYQRFEQHLKQK